MANVTQMGIPGAGSGVLQPKLKHKWQVRFQGLAKLVPGAASAARELTRQAMNVSRPSFNFDQVEIPRYNGTAYVAGRMVFEPCSMTVMDDIGGLASYAIQGQVETQQRVIGADLPGEWLNSAATGSDYKFGMILELLDGNETVVETWKYSGCWIMSVDYGDLDYSTSEAATINMQIRYDHVAQDISGSGFGTAIGGAL